MPYQRVKIMLRKIATIINIVKEQLGDGYKLTGTSIELILKLSQEFAYKLADEANNLCVSQGKKTINNTHVLGALKVKIALSFFLIDPWNK